MAQVGSSEASEGVPLPLVPSSSSLLSKSCFTPGGEPSGLHFSSRARTKWQGAEVTGRLLDHRQKGAESKSLLWKEYKTVQWILEGHPWFNSECWFQSKRKWLHLTNGTSTRHPILVFPMVLPHAILSRRFQWYLHTPCYPRISNGTATRHVLPAFPSPAEPSSYLRGDGPAVSHLENPELFAAYLKALKDLVCKEDAARDVQDVQIMALCR